MSPFYFKWQAEIMQNGIFIAFVIFLVVLVTKISGKVKSLETKLKRKKKPRKQYVDDRLLVCNHIDECGEGNTTTRFQTIYDLEKKIVLGNIMKQSHTVLALEKKLKDKLESVYDALFKQKSMIQKKQLRQALIFELKSRIMKHPHDIQNSRRVFGIIEIFDEIWNKNNNNSCFRRFKSSISDCWTSLPLLTCVCCSPDGSQGIKLFNCCCEGTVTMDCSSSIICSWGLFACCSNTKSSPSKYSTVSIVKTVAMVVIFTIGTILYDYIGDIKVILAFLEILMVFNGFDGIGIVELWSIAWNRTYVHNSTSILYTSIISSIQITNNSSLQNEDVYYLNELYLPLCFLFFILLFSTLSLIYHNPIRMLATQFQTTLKMESPTVEENDEPIPVSGTLHRYDLSIEEASNESVFQFMVQWGAYFSISMIISIAAALEGSFKSTGLTLIDDLLKFEVFYISGIGSLLALTLAQVKSNKIQNEFNTTLNIPVIGNIFYFVACLANTVMTSMILANLATSGLDCSFLLPAVIDPPFAVSGVIVSLWFIPFLCGHIHRISPPNHNILPIRLPTEETMWTRIFRHPRAIIRSAGKLWTRVNRPHERRQETSMVRSCRAYFTFTSMVLSMVYKISGMFTSMILPTSQSLIPSKGHFSYHTSLLKSPDLLKLLRTQLIVYIVLIMSAILLNIGACSILEFSPTFIAITNSNTNLTNLTPSNVSPARYNLLIHTTYGIPLSFFLSYALVGLYFMKDSGFFSVSNMEFKYKYVVKNNLFNSEVVENKNYPQDHLINEDGSEEATETNDSTNGWSEEATETNDSTNWCLKKVQSKLGTKDFWLGDDKGILDEAVRGKWMDLNGEESEDDEDYSDDGPDILLNCAEGSPEYRVKMTFFFYTQKKKEEPKAGNDETSA